MTSEGPNVPKSVTKPLKSLLPNRVEYFYKKKLISFYSFEYGSIPMSASLTPTALF